VRKLWCNVFVLIVSVLICASAARSDDADNAGQRVASVRVEGNVNIDESVILSKVRIRTGDEFDPVVATEDTKRIAELDGVEYCYYNTTTIDGNLQLTFVVAEKNVIRSIEFEGNRAFGDKKLRGKLGFKVGDYLDSVLAQTYISTIVEFYRKKGFAFAEVSLDAEKASVGKLVYIVKEGPRVKVVSVKFSGNSAIKSADLNKAIKSRTRGWLVFQKYYREEVVTEDVARLQRAYQKRGFLNATVEARRQFNADKTKVRIVFDIVEGSAYSVENTLFVGSQQFDNQKLYEQLKLQNGQTYNEQRAELDTKQLLKLYKENGFLDARVERGIKFVSDRTVDVEYTITEGGQFRIGQVIITGNEHTRDKVVRHVLDEYDFQPGKWYNADIARGDGKGELERVLQRSLLTERDGATITPAGQMPGQKDAQVSIMEGKTGMVMLGAGVTSDSGVIGQLIFEQRNFDISDTPKSLKDFIVGNAFRGAGQTFRIALQPGTELSEYSVSFTEPYLNDRPTSLSLVGSSWTRWRESYDEQRTKGFVGLEKRRRDKWRPSIGFRAENVDVKDVDRDAPVEIKDVAGGNFLAGVQLGIAKDLTDSRFLPTSGHNFSLAYEQVAGDYTFGILSGAYRRYYTLYEDLAERKTVLATKLLAATVVSNAPPFEKFYAGGTGTYGIRGFEYRGVSTRGLQTNVDPNKVPQREDPIGSDWIFIANAEVTIPLVSDNVSALFFVDSGAIDTGGYRAGVGTGIQIMIPQWFGPVPMRFEFAVPLLREDDDRTQVFSFSVGGLF